jgi:hypothetical protein
MLNRILTKSALAAVLLGLGVSASAEEAGQAQAEQAGGPTAGPAMAPGMPLGPYGMPAMPYGGMPYGPYGMGMPYGGMPYGPYGMGMPHGPMMGGPMGRPTMGQSPAQSIQEREKELDERLGRIDPSTQSRRQYFEQRRQQRKEDFERQAMGSRSPMGRYQSPTAPTAYSMSEAPTAPPVPSRADVDKRAQELEAYGRSMYPYSQARRDYYRGRRQYRKEAFERQMQAAQARQPGGPGMMSGMAPGMMPYGPMGMGGPGMSSQNPWAPAPGEE